MPSHPSILITGAEGFVGPYLISELSPLGIPIHATFIVPQGKRTDILPENRWVYCDITDRQAVFEVIHSIHPSFIYHLAGISHVPTAESNRQKALNINVSGTLNLLEAVADEGISTQIVLISSGEVYGKIDEEMGAVREDFFLHPTNFYAATKAAAEKIAWPFYERGVISLTIFRPFNHIGPGQSPSFVVSDFARQVAKIFLSLAEPKVHVGDIDVYRDFTDVRDIVRGYRLIYENFTPGCIYNLASGSVVAIREILEELIALSQKSIEIVRDPARFRKAEAKKIQVDISRFKEATGWAPRIPLKKTLRDVFEYWVKKLSRDES